MSQVSVIHTWQLSDSTIAAIRKLLDAAFDGDFGDEDWDHSLGGVHALVWDGDELIGHGAVVQRRLLHADRALRTGYVEGVAVRADRRRQGVGGVVMAALEDVVRGAYALGALSASEEALEFYAARGWQRWRGRTFALTPAGVERTEEEDDGVFVLPVAPLDLSGDLTCDWRDGDVW
ncbi:aminoglycoside 2'-N-acetyltransferase I [Saccharothrix ecbatanensis]|uniref:Aminoglycoside 2'-N-acetyltransferase I n=1 Tax=Saccharothrix ecbatanensis TaxID=1105145 RepID=A0A7W9HNH0_9PSEU|nr:GNAT family N-acetyltransferase [Saccharothrix ecbatanensis]MBB5805385.1 aminoglycoside 2'-N-acetyltransferase I [Saccharothrix ecbatanensis]